MTSQGIDYSKGEVLEIRVINILPRHPPIQIAQRRPGLPALLSLAGDDEESLQDHNNDMKV